MKAKAILASACLQDGDWRKAVVHLGDYASLSAVTGFCQESNWPVGINEIQRQERRRVHWGVYQQEQYLSSSFGFPSRQREADAIVKYPAEVSDDEDITQTSVCCQLDELSFLVGWNFCTDLYRLLERLRGSAKAAPQMPRMEPGNKIESQTLRMLLVGINKPSVHLRCAIASELLDELSSIPMAFFNASSIVSLHHLARIGHILSDITKDTLPIWTYLQVRNILIVLADLLEKIESARLSNAGTALKLRAEIDRIGNCIKQASQNDQQQTSQLSMSQSLLTDWRNASTGSPATESTDRTNMTRSPGPPNGSSRTAMQVSSQYADHARDWPPGESILVGHGLDSMREIQRHTSVPTTFNPLMIPPNHQGYGAISMSQPGTMQEQQDMQFDAAHGQRLGVDNLLSGDFFFSQWPYLAS
ncbi:hypothetical protein PFICI_12198 [Pestalotiopsis fici W106-1]|uniref:Transcription factor domain-containing protein n=1 Tax=Pestalotiopsis fici (strain W106-1 / CGMCC3.15140) TaxID=1229662 RepID=W3WVE6_PESFW|nr:uncharacterized protein PFICI_12198 [Pestalotiopsis fici W106-1]ETS76811.1 hypothetical protein PFICI_12198 [Pestalotiopsis fici W106-1]